MKSLLSRITIDPEICHGQPVVRGLRYPVEALLEYLAGGDSVEDLLTTYPDLEREDILACLAFAAQAAPQADTPPPLSLHTVEHASATAWGREDLYKPDAR